MPLLTQPWDSMRAIAAGAGGGASRVEPFIARLPYYSPDPAAGCNTLVLRAEYSALADERVFIAVSIGSVTAGDAVSAMAHEQLMHVVLRIDPGKADPSRPGSGEALRYRCTQASKSHGHWNMASASRPSVQPWPLRAGVPFWLRLTLQPRGCFSYLNGRALAFTRHASGGAWTPSADPALHVLLPVAGDAGEKPTWRVHGAWWGHCAVDGEGEALAAASAARAAPAPALALAAGEVYVTGLPPGASAADVRAAFAHWGAQAATEPVGAASTVRLADAAPAAVARVVAEADRRVTVLGVTVSVTQALVRTAAQR